jgi:hypothetical protein
MSFDEQHAGCVHATGMWFQSCRSSVVPPPPSDILHSTSGILHSTFGILHPTFGILHCHVPPTRPCA